MKCTTCKFQLWWRFCFSIILLYTLNSCKFDPNEPISWKTDLLLPIAHSSLGIFDIISDSSNLEVESDQFVNVVYRDTLLRTGLSEVFIIPDTTIIRRFDLSTFELADQVIVQQITLAQLARGLVEQGNIVGSFILANHGNELPPINEDIKGLTSGVIDVDASDLFEYAALNQGDMEIRITNNLPLSLKNIQFQLKNSSLGDAIVSDFYPIVGSGQSVAKNYLLDNKEVESALAADMSNLDIGNSGGLTVPIDTNDYVEVKITVRNLKASEATAIFPDQTVANEVEDLEYEFSGENEDIELKSVRVKSGFIRAEIVSTIEDTIQFEYTLTGAMRYGMPPVIKRKIPPSNGRVPSQFVELFDLTDYELDMTKGGLTVNTLEQSYQIDLVYSGKLVHIDLEDSVYARFQLIDIVPDYVQGYLGQGTIDVVGTEQLKIFQPGEIQYVNFEEATAKISFTNSIGLDLEGTLFAMRGFRRATGGLVDFNSDIFDFPISIPGPNLPDVDGSKITTIRLDNKNSNLRELVNLIPDEIYYDLEILYNPYGKDSINGDNFANFDSEVITYLDLEIPLHGAGETFILTDTVEVDFSGNEAEDIESGTLSLIVENGFPLEATVYGKLIDQFGQDIDILFDGQKIIPGEIGTTGGRVELASKSTIEKTFDREQIDDILNNSYQLILGYQFSTKRESVKFYNDYRINAKLVAEFKYGL